MKKKTKKREPPFAKKKRPVDSHRLTKIKERIKTLCEGDGLSASVLKKQLKGISKEDSEEALNQLLHEKRVQMFVDDPTSKDPFFVTVSKKQAEKYKGLSSTDVVIYRLIEASSDIGISVRSIKYRTKLQQKEIAKTIKMLKGRKLVKEVKTVKGRNRKVYMCFEITPSKEITGGVWYNETEYNTTLIENLRDFVVTFVLEKKKTSVKNTLDYLKRKGQISSNIVENDLKQIFTTLVDDGVIEETEMEDGTAGYKESNKYKIFRDNTFTDIPCSTCPLSQICTDLGNISPSTCVYLQEWQKY